MSKLMAKYGPFIFWTLGSFEKTSTLGAWIIKILEHLISNYYLPQIELPMFFTNNVVGLLMMYNFTNYIYYAWNSREKDYAYTSLRHKPSTKTRMNDFVNHS
jgi:hypothetical protein